MLLSVDGLRSAYGGMIALDAVSLAVAPGEIVAVLGANGAGKSTLLKSIAGWVRPERGEIRFRGRVLNRVAAHQVSRAGIALVPEGRRLFPRLSVRDNLVLGGYARPRGGERQARLDGVFALFPRLGERLDQRAVTLSGGEQQMLAIGRALMSAPTLLMLDEPSQGIMPKLVDELLDAVCRIRKAGTTVLLVEQRVAECLAIADRAYVLQTGRIALAGSAAEIAANGEVRRAYLGL
jgi:branched-chain amino acid transport system ATP-binding protein